MGLSVSICDDAREDREYVDGLVRAWAASRQLTVRINEFSSAESFLFGWEDEKVDIILLDIEMGGMDGVELAKRLRRESDMVQIVFITGYAEYIEEGYEVSALHFLVKPLREEKLFSVLDRAVERLKKAERVLDLDTADGLVRVALRDIRYIDVRSNYVTVHGRSDCTVKRTLSDMEAELDERFYRVGRSAIVNLTRIARVTRSDIILLDGTAIPLPRGAYQGVNRAIIDLEGSHGAV